MKPFLHFSLLVFILTCTTRAQAVPVTGKAVMEYHHLAKLIKSNQNEQAITEIDLQIKKYPTDPQLFLLKAVSLNNLSKTDEAIEIYKQMISNTPELAEPHNNLAVIYAKQGNLIGAQNELLAAVKINPSQIQSQGNLAQIYLKLALVALKKAQASKPENTTLKNRIEQIEKIITPVK